MEEIVDEGRTGFLVEPGRAPELARLVASLAAAPDRLRAMRRAARDEYERAYAAPANLPMLLDVYRDAISARARVA